MTDIVGWIVVIALMAIGMIGAFIPVVPGAALVLLSFLVYGWVYGFEPFGIWFWIIQSLIVLVIIVSDYMISAYGVKRYGGSRRSAIGSIIGLVIGPFVIPVFGIVLGPFLGGMIGEWTLHSDLNRSAKAGYGALIGLFSSAAAQFVLQFIMIVLFGIWIWWNG